MTRTHWAIFEGGLLVKHGAFAVPLAWTRVQFGFTHMVYHSGLEFQERDQYGRDANGEIIDKVFHYERPHHDDRVWDDFQITRLNREEMQALSLQMEALSQGPFALAA